MKSKHGGSRKDSGRETTGRHKRSVYITDSMHTEIKRIGDGLFSLGVKRLFECFKLKAKRRK